MQAFISRLSLLLLLIPASFVAQTNYFTISVAKTDYTCVGGSANISVSGGQSPYFLNWNNGLQGNHASDLLPGNYTISIVDGTGRDTVITFTIEESKCKVSVNTTFSPNGDDINDALYMSNWQYYPNFTFQVFNRWGQLVHQQKGEFKPWDGRHLGAEVPVGTYYYIFFYNGTDGDHEKGSITIMR